MAEVTALSEEQREVALLDRSAKVQAFAGSGKSTSLLGYCQEHDKERILYLCFNRPNKLQFQRRIKNAGLHHVSVETAHGLARSHVYGHTHVELTGSYSPVFLQQAYHHILKLSPYEDRSFIIHHGIRFIKYFCASNQHSLSSFSYLHFVKKGDRNLVDTHYETILQLVYAIMHDMEHIKIPVLHDYYLKKFHLQKPELPYETILYDEVQDCSPVMIDIVESQQSKRIYVGDPHQQVYAWRGAVNAFEHLQLPKLELGTSYRFSQGIGNLALDVLKWKEKLSLPTAIYRNIESAGPNPDVKYSALIARSTSGVLKEAVAFIRTNKNAKVCFQGGLSGYIHHELGFSILDLHSFMNGMKAAKPFSFLSDKSPEDVEAYATMADDHLLATFLKLCKEYKNELPAIIGMIKRAEVPDLRNYPDALLISTAHRVKGLEFREVTVAGDFFNYYALEHMLDKTHTMAEIIEEINILYVVVTRAAQEVWMPNKLIS